VLNLASYFCAAHVREKPFPCLFWLFCNSDSSSLVMHWQYQVKKFWRILPPVCSVKHDFQGCICGNNLQSQFWYFCKDFCLLFPLFVAEYLPVFTLILVWKNSGPFTSEAHVLCSSGCWFYLVPSNCAASWVVHTPSVSEHAGLQLFIHGLSST
jgi:hypothetical protein